MELMERNQKLQRQVQSHKMFRDVMERAAKMRKVRQGFLHAATFQDQTYIVIGQKKEKKKVSSFIFGAPAVIFVCVKV